MNEAEALQAVAGEGRAMNWMIMLLIASHPAAGALLQQFDAATLEWTDELAVSDPLGEAPQFHQSLQNKLAAYRRLLVAAAAQSGD